MDIGAALRTMALADPSVTTAFGTRMYPLRLPQAVEYPAATYQLISSIPEYSLEGSSNLNEGRVQFDVYAETYDALIAASEALKAALDGERSDAIGGVFWTNEVDWPVPETDRAATVLYRKTLECNPWFSQ